MSQINLDFIGTVPQAQLAMQSLETL